MRKKRCKCVEISGVYPSVCPAFVYVSEAVRWRRVYPTGGQRCLSQGKLEGYILSIETWL